MPTVTPAPAAVAAAGPWAELAPVSAAEARLRVLSPVASAITLPLLRKPRKLSIRSGRVIKANDPARAIIRGTAMIRSLGEGLRSEVAFDVEALIFSKAEPRTETEEGKSISDVVPGASPATASPVEDIVADL